MARLTIVCLYIYHPSPPTPPLLGREGGCGHADVLKV